MKKNTLQKMMLAAALLTLVSCTQDELMKQSTALPDGVYPITFTAAQALPEETPNGTPQTRVSDKDDNTSSWTNGDKIKVTVNRNGYTNEDIVCTLNEKGEVTQSDKQLYWQSAKATAQFTGVYPEKTENIPLNGQSTKLAYVMRAPEEQGSYKKPAQLKFKHQLAKLCVTLKDGNKPLTGDYKLSVLNYASCDNTSGGAQGNGNLMFIPMRYNAETQCYEANIVPGTFEKDTEFYRIQQTENGKVTKEATAKLTNASTFKAGYVYSATVTATTSSKWVPVITDRGEEYNIDNDIIVNLGLGSLNDDPTRIKVDPQKNVTVTIRESRIGSNSFGHNPPIGPIVSIGAGATVTLKVEGENYFHTRSGAGIEMQNGSSLTIIGDGGEKTKLYITTTGGNNEMGCPCIGSAYNKEGTLELESITIKDVKLDLTQGGNYGWFSSPAIGLTHVMEGNTKQSCKSIKIENSEVKITNNGDGACIGTPAFSSYVTRSNLGYNIDEIIIASSTIDATSHGYGACIGFGVKSDDNITGTIGTISINTTDLKFKKTKTDSGAFCVGRGQMNTQVNLPTITKGISIDGKDKGKEGYDPPMQ